MISHGTRLPLLRRNFALAGDYSIYFEAGIIMNLADPPTPHAIRPRQLSNPERFEPRGQPPDFLLNLLDCSIDAFVDDLVILLEGQYLDAFLETAIGPPRGLSAARDFVESGICLGPSCISPFTRPRSSDSDWLMGMGGRGDHGSFAASQKSRSLIFLWAG